MSVIDRVNSRVLHQHVALVRRLLSSSQHPEVVVVGSLGEINFVVDSPVSEADLQILDMMLQSESARNGRECVLRSLQHQRETLQSYVGKHLIRAGLTWASRHGYQVTIDPEKELVVLLSGFDLPDSELKEPVDASPAERARWIFENYSGSRDSGERVVELLLAGREVTELTTEELHLLARGYNSWGQNKKAFEVAKVVLSREPQNVEWMSSASLFLSNECIENNFPKFLTECDTCISTGIGPPAFWHLEKASYFVKNAVGEFEREDYEWSHGDGIRHPELLRLAAEAMEAALVCEPELRGRGNWNERFAAVLGVPEFRHLMG